MDFDQAQVPSNPSVVNLPNEAQTMGFVQVEVMVPSDLAASSVANS